MKIFMLGCFIVLFAMFSIACKNKQEQVSGDEVATTVTAAPTQEASVTPAGNNSTPVAESITPTLAPTIAPANVKLAAPETDYVSNEMYNNAVLNEGDLTRLAAVMKKARNGEEITVAVVGGSITQGSLATSQDKCYASIFFRWWQATFPDTKINFINDGVGATTSYLAVHRIDKDLLPKKPDVVVVEFSVNDSNTIFFKETYEDLIRRILKQDNNPAVIPLFMAQEDGTSAITQHMLVSFTYNLPRIAYGSAELKEIANGAFTWKDVSPDNIHPNDRGHAMVGEILWKYLNSVYTKLDSISEEVTPLTTPPIFNEAYIDATILDSSNTKPTSYGSFEKAKVFDRFPNNWQTTSGNDAITFDTEAQNIGIMYYKTIDGKSGQYDVYIDGAFVVKLNADFTGGWGNYAETVEIYRSKEKQKHTIEIKKADDSTGDVFSILGLLIS